VKSTVEETAVGQRAIAIEIEPEEVTKKIEHVVAKYRRKVQIPGFRKGKAPPETVRKMHWENIEKEVIESIVPEVVNEVLVEKELRVASPPQIEDLKFTLGEPLTFVAKVELWPELEVDSWSGLEIDEVVFEVEDIDRERFLDNMRERMSTFEPIERPTVEGDFLSVQVQAADKDGNRLRNMKREDLQFEAGGQNLLPEFREATIGAVSGDERFIEVNYPEEFEHPELAGEQRFFMLKVVTTFEREQPEVNDEFAQRVDPELKDVEALQAKIRERLEEEEKSQARRRTEGQIVGRLLERYPFEVPPGVIAHSLEQAVKRQQEQNPKLDEEQARTAMEPQVQAMWQQRLILDAIARKESIEVTDEDVDERIGKMAGESGDPRRVRKQLEENGELRSVQLDILDRKVFDLVLESVDVNRSEKPRPREA